MKKIRNYFLLTAITALGLLLYSCDVNITTTEKTLEEQVTATTDYTAVLALLDIDDTDETVEEDVTKSVSDVDVFRCWTVTYEDNGTDLRWPRLWTISYTDTACTNYFGNVKLGEIHISLTDYWKRDSSLRTITYDNFTINGNLLEGTQTILNTGFNEDENLTFERKFMDGSYTKGDTATMTWTFDRDVEMIAGYDTFPFADDEYLVTGSAEGVNFDGVSFQMNIVDALYYTSCSRYPISGTISIQTEGAPEVTIDFGDGTCDNIAEMTVNDETTEITLNMCTL